LVLAGCEYTGPDERGPSPTATVTPQQRSFEENMAEVARLLGAPPTDPGMPSEAEPVGKLFLVLAPGDYMVTGACSGVYGAKLTIVRDDGVPEASEFRCSSALDRFFRHDGGPVTISAIPRTGKPSATGVRIQPNPDPRLSELEDLSEWSGQLLQPPERGELRGTNIANGTTKATLMAEPGRYNLDFVCAGASFAQLSLATSAGAEVLAPVRVPCDGRPVRTPLSLPTKGADISFSPLERTDTRFTFRLVPAGDAAPAG
jgi:hypothetical protein